MKRGKIFRETGSSFPGSDKAESEQRFGGGLQRGKPMFNKGNDDTFERLRDLDVDSFGTQESNLSREIEAD